MTKEDEFQNNPPKSNNTKTIRISATIAAIATIMTFATFFTAATTAYAQANTTGNATTAGAAKPASSSPSSASMQSPAGSVADINSSNVTIQKTGVSDTDPVNSAHQLVSALPPRSDGKVWVGTVTWTASKPVEVVVLHTYNSNVTADTAHGQPYTAPFGKGSVAISLVKTPSGTPVASGSMPFAGNALGFHTLNGAKFVVTYTVDATAKQLTKATAKQLTN